MDQDPFSEARCNLAAFLLAKRRRAAGAARIDWAASARGRADNRRQLSFRTRAPYGSFQSKEKKEKKKKKKMLRVAACHQTRRQSRRNSLDATLNREKSSVGNAFEERDSPPPHPFTARRQTR